MKADPTIIRELEKLLMQWEDEVNTSNYTPIAKGTYIQYAKKFVRWCKDDFTLRGFPHLLLLPISSLDSFRLLQEEYPGKEELTRSCLSRAPTRLAV